MQLKPKASMLFTKNSIPDKYTFGLQVISKLTENILLFPNLPHSISTLESKNNELHLSASSALGGGTRQIAAMNNAEKNWDKVFRDTANYVSLVAEGDAEKIYKSGFMPTKIESSPVQKPEQPGNFKLIIEQQQGEFFAQCSPMKNVKSFVCVSYPEGVSVSFEGNQMHITTGGKTITVIADTHRRVRFSRMPSGVKQTVQMYAVNNAGIGSSSQGQPVIPQ